MNLNLFMNYIKNQDKFNFYYKNKKVNMPHLCVEKIKLDIENSNYFILQILLSNIGIDRLDSVDISYENKFSYSNLIKVLEKYKNDKHRKNSDKYLEVLVEYKLNENTTDIMDIDYIINENGICKIYFGDR